MVYLNILGFIRTTQHRAQGHPGLVLRLMEPFVPVIIVGCRETVLPHQGRLKKREEDKDQREREWEGDNTVKGSIHY